MVPSCREKLLSLCTCAASHVQRRNFLRNIEKPSVTIGLNILRHKNRLYQCCNLHKTQKVSEKGMQQPSDGCGFPWAVPDFLSPKC